MIFLQNGQTVFGFFSLFDAQCESSGSRPTFMPVPQGPPLYIGKKESAAFSLFCLFITNTSRLSTLLSSLEMMECWSRGLWLIELGFKLIYQMFISHMLSVGVLLVTLIVLLLWHYSHSAVLPLFIPNYLIPLNNKSTKCVALFNKKAILMIY